MSGSNTTWTFPNANINLRDIEPTLPPDPTVLPLHLPLIALFAETGPVGVPVLGGANALQALFGTQFLNERSKYFLHPNVFAKRALDYQQIYMVRVADPAATAASLVLQCTITPKPIVQYQRTTSGAIIYNSSGIALPQLQSDGVTPTTQMGLFLSYSTRELVGEETISTIIPSTTTDSIIDGAVILSNNTSGISVGTVLSVFIGGNIYTCTVTNVVANTSITVSFSSSFDGILTVGTVVSFTYNTTYTGTVGSTVGGSSITSLVILTSNTTGVSNSSTLNITIGGVTYVGYVTNLVSNTSITVSFGNPINVAISNGTAVAFGILGTGSINSTHTSSILPIDNMNILMSNTSGIPYGSTLSITISGTTYIGYVSTIVTNTSITVSFLNSITTSISAGTAVSFNYGTTHYTGTVNTTNSSVSITYPIMAFSTYVGSAGNGFGFRLFYNNNYNTSLISNIGAMTYSFQPVKLNTLTNIESPIYDIYTNPTQTFSFMPGAIDPTTDTYYELSDVIQNNFQGLTGLPYQFYVYGSNVGAIGTAILAVSPELGSMSPYLVNILSGLDAASNPYQHVVIAPSSTSILNSNVVLYLEGGSDGSLSKSTLEAQTIQLVSGELNPLIADSFRYPFTHIYDSGYALSTKQALMNIFSIRDDVGLVLSTQDVANPPNTAAQDQSTGSALRTAALLNPESIEYGTQACRVTIFQQCGRLSDTQLYKNIVPATINSIITHCIYTGTDRITGEPKGRPNSEVTILDINSLNWSPTTPQQMQLSWNTGLNYIQYCDFSTLFYPDLLSVYPIDSSLLSSELLVDYASIYLKKIIRRQWTIMVGRDDPPKTLYHSIATAIDAAAAYVFNGLIDTSTVVHQTAVDTALGYQLSVTTTVFGNMPNRVWKVTVPITRAS